MDLNKLVRIDNTFKTEFFDSNYVLQNLDVPSDATTYSIKSSYNIVGKICVNTSNIIKNYKPSYNCTLYEKLITYNHWPKCIVSNDSHCMGIGQNSNTKYFNGVILGGSSSGSAISLLCDNTLSYSICSDTAGSLVLPCVQNKLFGFKPSRGAISRYGLHEYCPILDRVCIMSKNVHTLKTIYEYICGIDDKDPYTAMYVECTNEIDTVYDYRDKKIDYTCLTNYWKPWISSYAMSANNKYDGVRFNPYIMNAESDDKKIIDNRNRGLTALVKRRILSGAQYIANKLVLNRFEAPKITDIFKIDDSLNFVILLKHTIKTSFKEIGYNEFEYGLANCLNYCSVVVPYKDHSIEFIAKTGFEKSLLKFVQNYEFN